MTDVAYAADAIEMRDISGADFRFAKTLTLPFFGSGMVDLPPGGTKRIKNSRKMQMVFFVFYGRVTVELGTPTTRFSIGRGGMWQVPRGKHPKTFCILCVLQILCLLLIFVSVFILFQSNVYHQNSDASWLPSNCPDISGSPLSDAHSFDPLSRFTLCTTLSILKHLKTSLPVRDSQH